MSTAKSRKRSLEIILSIVAVLLVLLYIYFNQDNLGSILTEDINGIRVTFVDVGQGDCSVIQHDAYVIVIDAGDEGAWPSIKTALSDLSVQKIDLLIATHPHADHIGAMDDLLNNVEVTTIAMADAAPDTAAFEHLLDAIDKNGAESVFPVAGETMQYGDVKLQFLHPVAGAEYDNYNDYSLVVRMVSPYGSVMFTGDAETSDERSILDSGISLASDILKVGHHGSNTSTSKSFLKAVAPQYAVICVGEGNDYGHPKEKVLNRLTDAGVKTFRTDLNGTVVFYLMPDGITYDISK